MSDFHERFVSHLRKLAEHDRGALAALRRSLGFAPGTYAAAMPCVEPFAVSDGTREPQRQALYLTAGLFATNPRHRTGTSLAGALAEVKLKRDSDSIERRFIALLSADAEALPVHLRHAASLLAAEELAFDYAALAQDLGRWLDPWQDDARDRVRQRWARDFYRRLAQAPSTDNTPTKEDTP
ncbi:MAG: type I-E CRISPR-associated protein Cse2/CasB [Rubrivivax sp.]|nr:type I-E CRISPR-associated protein Cse2/CasB [Rubrivivax sp.]